MSVLALLILLQAAASAVVPEISIDQTNMLQNNISNNSDDNTTRVPQSVGIIDPRFTVVFRPGQETLSPTRCMLSAVYAMTQLALQDFSQRVTVRNYVDPLWPEVEISPVASGRWTEARFLLWGVWQGIRWMINHNTFVDLMIVASWDGIPECTIWIRRASSGSSSSQKRMVGTASDNSTVGLATPSRNVSTRNLTVEYTLDSSSVTNVRNPSLDDEHMTVAVTLYGERILMTEVFSTIFEVLEYLAHFPCTDEVSVFEISPVNLDTTMGVRNYRRAPSARGPFLQYQWAILAIGQVPAYMVQRNRFTEVDIDIAVNGVQVGEAFLYASRLV